MDYVYAKSIVSTYKKDNMWFGFNYNMNIYRGCSHGCIYCDSRSSCYNIDNFDKVRAKENAISIIKNELKSKRKSGVIGTGAMSDPYNPLEKEYELTRKALEIVNYYKFGIGIMTKSSLITRDIDILKEINRHSDVIVNITITTFDDNLCKKIEPNVAVSSERFKAIKKLSDNGIFVGILLMPILPFINDNVENIVSIVKMAYECGTKFIYPAFGVTLRDRQRDYYFNKISEIFDDNYLIKEYIKNYGYEYNNESVKSKELYNIFKNECKKYNILYKMSDIISGYKKEDQIGKDTQFDQISFL